MSRNHLNLLRSNGAMTVGRSVDSTGWAGFVRPREGVQYMCERPLTYASDRSCFLDIYYIGAVSQEMSELPADAVVARRRVFCILTVRREKPRRSAKILR